MVDRNDRREPEPSRRDREDARAAADVEQASALELEQELQAETGRRMTTCPERAAGVDHDRVRRRGRSLPRRSHPERPDLDRPVERAPPFLPAVRHRVRPDRSERSPETFLARCVCVGDELDPVARVAFLEPLGEELEHERTSGLGALQGNNGGDASERRPQRNALFSFSKNPSSRR